MRISDWSSDVCSSDLEGEQVQAVLPVREYDDKHFVFFATRNGTVKKTPLTEYAYQLQRGKIAINLDEGDALIGVALSDGSRDIMQLGRASWRGRVCQYVEISVVAGTLKKKTKK